MRTFVALPVPPAGGPHNYLEACQRALREGRPDVKWVSPDHFHVTLRFLGEIGEADLPDIREAVRQAAASVHPFTARLTGWGAFPNAHRPQTLWVAMEDTDGELAALERTLTEKLKRLGIPPDTKRFHPHVTLGRVRSPGGTDVLKNRLSNELPRAAETSFPARHITLFKSELSAQGPHYTPLLEAPLGQEE